MRSHLEELEAESMHILREVAAQFERPVLLFSGGKDSIVLAALVRRAFHPAPFPFPCLHVDTGHNFTETLQFRDRYLAELRAPLLVASVEESIRAGRVLEEEGPRPSRNAAQSVTLLDAIREHRFDACVGGARRDEEKARAKERIFSHRNAEGRWEPRDQRPELWDLLNGCKRPGEHFRVFPLSNWTEVDVWEYLTRRGIAVPSLYFAHEREVVQSGPTLLAFHSRWVRPLPSESVVRRTVRFRTIGDMTCTGATLSQARTPDEVLTELRACRVSERGGRADDRRSQAAMEERKRQGYF